MVVHSSRYLRGRELLDTLCRTDTSRPEIKKIGELNMYISMKRFYQLMLRKLRSKGYLNYKEMAKIITLEDYYYIKKYHESAEQIKRIKH